MKIYLIGASGFIAKGFEQFFKSKDIKFYSINKKNYNNYKNTKCNILINTAGNSSTILAKKNFFDSYNKNLDSIFKTLKDFKFDQYVLISSTLIYNDTSRKFKTKEDTLIDSDILDNYGFLKFTAEQIVKRNLKKYLIIRTCGVVGSNLKKNVIYDLLNRKKLFDNKRSKYNIITTKKLAEIVFELLRKKLTGIFNVTSNKNIEVQDIKNLFIKRKIQYSRTKKKIHDISTTKISKYVKIFSSEKYLKEFFFDCN